jgi:LL-diaminopimelate aminotransferase
MAAPTKKKGLAAPSQRLEAIPPYMFAELEQRIEAKLDEGIEVISLGIGDPDTPTFRYIVEAMREAVGDPEAQRYPSNRGRREFREAFADFYLQRFGVEIDPVTEVIPAIGAKECIYNLCFAFLDPGDVALASDPGYPVYTSGPVLAGAEAYLLPLRPDLGFVPDLDAIGAEKLDAARLLFINYPNNPTGAVVPDGFFERVVELAERHEILVVHDNAYSETTYDGYVAPSFLATPRAKEVGVEVFSLSKGYNMTGWRCAAILGNAEAIKTYWRLKTNVDSGLFEAVQLAGAAALRGPRGAVEEMCGIYERRRGRCRGSQGHHLHLGAGAERSHLRLLLGDGPGGGGSGGLAWIHVRSERRGLLPDLPDDARRAAHRGGATPAGSSEPLAGRWNRRAGPREYVACPGMAPGGRIGLYRPLS